MVDKDRNCLRDLWVSYKLKGDIGARNELIIHYSPLVNRVVGRMSIKYLDYIEPDDLMGYGIFGLIDAIDKFDIDKGVRFETYASFRIRGSILDQIRKQDWIPRNLREKAKEVNRAVEALEMKLGREPEDLELAEHLGIPLKDLHRLIGQIHSFLVVSLDEDLNEVIGVVNHKSDSYITPEKHILAEEIKKTLATAVDSLNEKEQKVISLYYFEELTLKEIGMVIGVSESRVSQLHSRALLKLKQLLGSELNVH